MLVLQTFFFLSQARFLTVISSKAHPQDRTAPHRTGSSMVEDIMGGECGAPLLSHRTVPSDVVVDSSLEIYPYCSEVLPLKGGSRVSTLRKSSLHGEHGCVSNWLQAMRAASPPRSTCLNVEGDLEGSKQALEARYLEWTVHHPSALDYFDKLMGLAKGKQVVLFLDYDGTLAPIVEDPESAYMSDEMRSAVKEVAAQIPTAIISGRRRDEVYQFVQLPELFYAGSHGMDIVGPLEGYSGIRVDGFRDGDEQRKEASCLQKASDLLPMISEVYKALLQKAKRFLGAKVDHNKFCVSVHFRKVEEQNWQLLAAEVHRVVKNYPSLRVTQGRKVLEIRPSIQWDKGKAVKFFMKTLDCGDQNNFVPVYVGDDQTDEDAFHVVNQQPNGYSILVSSAPKATSAAYSLKDPLEVMEFLHRLVKR